MIATGVIRAAARALPAVPSALELPAAELIGTLSFAAAPGARAAVLANLRVIAPERANAAAVRRVFVEQARNYVELFKLPRMRPAALLARVETSGWDHFLAAQERGRGVIVATAHLGPISIVGQLLVARGYETALTFEPERSEFQRAVNRARSAMGLQMVPTHTPFGAVRALRAGKVLGLVVDRAVTGVGERVPFFGRECLLPSVHVALALRMGVPLLPAFSGRSRGGYTASFEPPLELRSTGDREADVREGVRQWALVLERYVRLAPEQWTVFEHVWAAERRRVAA